MFGGVVGVGFCYWLVFVYVCDGDELFVVICGDYGVCCLL